MSRVDHSDIRDGSRYRVTTVWEGVVTEVMQGSFLLTTAEGKRIRGTLGPHATFELALPENWPPQLGDLWRDKQGDLWFCVRNQIAPDGDDYALVNPDGDDEWASALLRNEMRGPLALVRREGGVS